ncbi:hypothetical protein, partial [Corynebacterium diphtheriae]|uniref:hypothetical protein n=1 Tax=Corynebacterium diphtheriae TaxID=1717 RepID=UPI001C63226E
MAWLGLAGVGGALVGAPPPLTPKKTALHTKSAQTAGLEAIWFGGALGGAPPPLTPKKTALHTKSAQTAGLEAIWCEVPRKILRNTP